MKKLTKGFTLIELMIVVAIIGILAAIAIPNFVKYQLRSKFSEASSNIEGLRKAEEALRQGERKIMLDATALNANYKPGTYWNLAGSVLPATAGGTAKSNWSALELAQAGYMDWSVEGATYFQYEVAGVTNCPVVGAAESAICYFAGARADIDGDTVNGEVALVKKDISGLLTPEQPTVVATWPGTIGSCGIATAEVFGTPCTTTGPDVF